jgi:hypothetical protein
MGVRDTKNHVDENLLHDVRLYLWMERNRRVCIIMNMTIITTMRWT